MHLGLLPVWMRLLQQKYDRKNDVQTPQPMGGTEVETVSKNEFRRQIAVCDSVWETKSYMTAEAKEELCPTCARTAIDETRWEAEQALAHTGKPSICKRLSQAL